MRVDDVKGANHTVRISPAAGSGRIALAIRVRGSLRELARDGFKNARHVAEDVVVPKSPDAVVVIDQPFIANEISRVIRVLASIHLNNETTFTAYQINRVRADRLLPDELVTDETARPQPIPKRSLGFRGVLPQTPGALGLDLSSSPHAATPPHPDCYAIRPLPARGKRLAPRAVK